MRTASKKKGAAGNRSALFFVSQNLLSRHPCEAPSPDRRNSLRAPRPTFGAQPSGCVARVLPHQLCRCSCGGGHRPPNSSRRRKHDTLPNPLPLHQHINLIRRNTGEFLNRPAGPQNLHRIRDRRLPQSKMQTQIILRKITGPAAHLIKLHQLPRPHRHSSSDGRSIALRPH
jgi:hypothetical protein